MTWDFSLKAHVSDLHEHLGVCLVKRLMCHLDGVGRRQRVAFVALIAHMIELWGCDCGTETFDNNRTETYGNDGLGDKVVPSLFHPDHSHHTSTERHCR